MTLLYIAIIVSATTVIARTLTPLIAWHVRTKQAKRRRARARGYLSNILYDDQWEPERELVEWPRINDGTYLQIPRKEKP